MARLKFVEDEKGEPTNEATGMYSKDGEYVEFDKPCMCVGQVCACVCVVCVCIVGLVHLISDLYCNSQVEVWLNALLDTMQSTIRHEMTEAVVSYEEKPRDQWLFEPPAQVRNKKNDTIILIDML